MTRNEFAREVANKMKNDYPLAGISNEDAKIWTMAVFDCLADTLLSDGKVILLNFGTFETYAAKPRKRGDIISKSTVIDPPRARLKFTIAPVLDKKIAELPVK
ncbi:MAG: HU family DNA-binding protein [Bacteroidaceae bacterium]